MARPSPKITWIIHEDEVVSDYRAAKQGINEKIERYKTIWR